MIGGHGMNTKKKRKKNRFLPMACAMGIFIGSVCNSYMNAYAEALPNFPPGVDLVSAADCIMSYMTSAGMFIANREWIDELYHSFGGGAGFYINDLYQNGLLTLDEAGHYVSSGLDEALQNQQAWSNLGLDQLFSVTAEEAAVGGGVAATGAGTIAGAIGGVATTGVLPLAIGVTGAYWGGISLGTLIAHQIGLYGKPILYGYTVDEAWNAAKNDIVLGNAVCTATRRYDVNSNLYMKMLTGPGYAFSYKKNNLGYICIGSMQNGTFVYSQGNYYDGTENGLNKYTNSTLNTSVPINQLSYTLHAANQFESKADFDAYCARWANGQETPKKYAPYSPDIITPDGNAVGDYDGQEIRVPSMTPEVNPTGQSIVPGGASKDDWLRWANGAKGNTDLNDPDSNADIFQQILQAIRQNVPTAPGQNPNPNPNPDPSPTPVPKPDYDPENPDQPEYDPKETEGPQDITNGNPWTTPDLLDRFPFCLPRDVLRCFEKLNVNERMAPYISWHFVTPLGIHFDFDLDLENYEGVAAILRTLELIAFIIGLALATRNLIGR